MIPLRPWRHGLFLVSLLTAFLLLPATPSQASEVRASIAVLRWLDKVTARVSTVEVMVGAALRAARIGTLEVIVRTCVTHPPEELPESAAFLDITEIKPGEPASEVFRGWMFASSPALSALEHPVYDVWLLECRNDSNSDAAVPNLPGKVAR
ncbi:MAG: DUF2155 domain-containing protein [Alphaproteobacteria bacterium]